MTFTYSGNPGASDRDRVRFMLGDTVSTVQSVSDEEIAYLLTEHTTPRRAAVAAAEAISTRFNRMALSSKTVGDLSLSYDYSATAERYLLLAARLRRGSEAGGMAIPTMADTKDKQFSVGSNDNTGSYPWIQS